MLKCPLSSRECFSWRRVRVEQTDVGTEPKRRKGKKSNNKSRSREVKGQWNKNDERATAEESLRTEMGKKETQRGRKWQKCT